MKIMFGFETKNQHRIKVIFSSTIALLFFVWLCVYLQKKPHLVGFGLGNVFLFFLINVHIIAIIFFLFLIVRNAIKLYLERKKEEPGSVFKKNLLFAISLFSVLPALFVFFTAGTFITQSIDRWFKLRIDSGFSQALQLHQLHTQQLRTKMIEAGNQFLDVMQQAKSNKISQNIVQAQCKDFIAEHPGPFFNDLYAWDRSGQMLYGNWRMEEQLWRSFRLHNDRTIKSLRGLFFGECSKIIKQKQCFDFYGSLYWAGQTGDMIVIGVYRYPEPVRSKLIGMQNVLWDYNQLNQTRHNIFINYFFTFSLIVLLILFLAIWCAFYLASGISRPVQTLLQAMKRMRQGDLDVQLPVDQTSDLQSLFTGFNEMINATKDAQDRLAVRNKEMMHMQALKTWQEAAKQMAHEIKNPLTPIQLATQRLQRRFKDVLHQDPIFFDCTNTILNQVKIIKDLVSHFSSFASLPAVSIEHVDVCALIKEVLLLYQLSYPSIIFSLHGDQESVMADTDREKLQLVLVNLLDNSVRALNSELSENNYKQQDTKKITIQVALSGDKKYFNITFADNGPGISKSVKETLFLPYVSTEKKNMGLGLAIVHDTIIQLGGTVVLQSSDSGSVFLITLPRVIHYQ